MQEKSSDFYELKVFMNGRIINNIGDYNEAREDAKEFFTTDTINVLDSSKLVKELVH